METESTGRLRDAAAMPSARASGALRRLAAAIVVLGAAAALLSFAHDCAAVIYASRTGTAFAAAASPQLGRVLSVLYFGLWGLFSALYTVVCFALMGVFVLYLAAILDRKAAMAQAFPPRSGARR